MERRIYTATELEQVNKAEEQLRAKGLDETNERIVDLIDGYFQINRVPVTVDTIFKLIEAQPGLKWVSAAELEYRRIAAENPAAAQQLADWLATSQGKPGTLVNDGDAAYENLTLLLTELHSRREDVSSKTIRDAIDRISHRPGRQLHFLPETPKQNPRSHAATDNGEPFLGKVNVNEPRWRRLQREREAAEAKDAANRPSAASVRSAEAVAAQQRASQLRGNSHSEDAQLQAIFVTTPGTSVVNWPETLQARLVLQRSLNRALEARRFIR